MAIREMQIPIGRTDPDKCQICKATERNGESYDKFFNDEEKKELEEIGKAHPDLASMLPPKGKKYMDTPKDKVDARRAEYRKRKKQAEVKGEYHHTHPLAVGGCPIHQDPFVEKAPADDAEKQHLDAVDDKINKVVEKARQRNRAGG